MPGLPKPSAYGWGRLEFMAAPAELRLPETLCQRRSELGDSEIVCVRLS